MKTSYQIAKGRDSRALAEFLAKEGQLLLPMLDLIEGAELAVDELIDMMGRATIEAVLLMSAEQVAGPKTPSKKGGAVRWHGRQDTGDTLRTLDDPNRLLVFSQRPSLQPPCRPTAHRRKLHVRKSAPREGQHPFHARTTDHQHDGQTGHAARPRLARL